MNSEVSVKNKKRNVKLDLIRFLGVLMIIIAHATPPGWLFQLRNFGTPLLIIGSALTYSYIYRNKEIAYASFFKKRFSRLIFPAWIFFTFFFLFCVLISFLSDSSYPFSTSQIFRTYSFYDGIGYVWVFKVYIILALITPIALKKSKSEISDKKYFAAILIAYIIYELVLFPVLQNASSFIRRTVLTILPYFIIYFYGLRMHKLSKIKLLVILAVSLVVFVFMAILKYKEVGFFVPTQEFKYPASLYYLIYAFFWVNLIYLVVAHFMILKNKTLRIVITWVSANSLWIYLWHILGVYFFETIFEKMNFFKIMNFFIFSIKFTFIIGFGTLFTLLQTKVVNKIIGDSGLRTSKFLSYLK